MDRTRRLVVAWGLGVLLPWCGSADSEITPSARTFGPELYDCSFQEDLPGRKSPAPLDCVIDPDCTGRRMVVAHRGAGGEGGVIAPENGLSALRAAVQMGVDGVEIDVRHTSDERLVLMHDGNLKRTTRTDADVASKTAAEIASIPLLAEADRYEGDFSCDRVPTLEEAFEIARDRLVIILDTKTDRVDLVVPAIVGAGMIDQVIISVSDAERAARARRIDPNVRVQVRPDTSEEVAEHLGLFDRSPEIFEIPWRLASEARPIIGPAPKLFADIFVEDGAAVLLNRQGDRDTSRYETVFDAGIDIVQTEYPGLLLEMLGRWDFENSPWDFLP